MAKNNKALRGLGKGLMQVSEMLLADRLAARREQALMEMREEYGLKADARADARFDADRADRKAEREADRAARADDRTADREERRLDRAARAKEGDADRADRKAQVVKQEVPVYIAVRDKDGKPVIGANGKPVMEKSTYLDAQGQQRTETREIYLERQADGQWTEVKVKAGQEPSAMPAPDAAPSSGEKAAAAPLNPDAPSAQTGAPQINAQVPLAQRMGRAAGSVLFPHERLAKGYVGAAGDVVDAYGTGVEQLGHFGRGLKGE